MSELSKKEKVDEFGEVFTPDHLVDDMLNMITQDQWEDPNQTFFEPSCGDGNFVVAMIKRRVESVNEPNVDDRIKIVLQTFCGVEIQEDNYLKTKGRIKELLLGYSQTNFDDLIDESIHHEDFFVFMKKYEDSKKEKVADEKVDILFE